MTLSESVYKAVDMGGELAQQAIQKLQGMMPLGAPLRNVSWSPPSQRQRHAAPPQHPPHRPRPQLRRATYPTHPFTHQRQPHTHSLTHSRPPAPAPAQVRGRRV